MKKILFFLLFCSVLHGASSGNPADPAILEEGFFIPDTSLVNLRASYELDLISNQRLKLTNFWKSQGFNLKNCSALTSLGGVILNFKDRFDLYANVGYDKINILLSYPNNLYKIESKNDLYYRAGGKLILFQMLQDTLFSVDVKYSIFHARGVKLFDNDLPVPSKNTKFKFKEWQISPGLAYETSLLSPFIGLSLKDTRLRLKSPAFSNRSYFKMKYLHKVGLFLGATLSNKRYFALTIEGRFINEQSCNLIADIRF
ncbi:MAG: hypothetical protein HZB76_02375 [Chlamydiae bacterium]|nr:hypothetical protein [Chlamydiota bacterium]